MRVFIIAGVGDHTMYITKRTRDWKRKYNLEVVPLKFGWRNDYSKNYSKLKNTITKFSGGEMVALIGISAGGSAAIRLASELSNVAKVITVCARTSRGGFKTVSLKSYPAYWESVDALSNIQLNKEVLVVKPLFDEIVSVRHMDYKDARVVNTPYILHIPSVLRTLSKQGDVIAEFIKS